MRGPAIAVVMVLCSEMLHGQSGDAPVAFEVASVKASPPPDGRAMSMGCRGGLGIQDPGMITCTNFTLTNLVTMAYGVARYTLSGIGATDNGRFEITARVPQGATRDQVKLMWQNLLAERFKLTAHREKKEIPGYKLVVAKGGLKIQESAPVPPQTAEASAPPRPDGPPKQQLDQDGYPVLPPGREPSMKGNRDKLRWRVADETMEQLASSLGAQLGQPVTDATGLKGKYDFTLSWAVGSIGGSAGEFGRAR